MYEDFIIQRTVRESERPYSKMYGMKEGSSNLRVARRDGWTFTCMSFNHRESTQRGRGREKEHSEREVKWRNEGIPRKNTNFYQQHTNRVYRKY